MSTKDQPFWIADSLITSSKEVIFREASMKATEVMPNCVVTIASSFQKNSQDSKGWKKSTDRHVQALRLDWIQPCPSHRPMSPREETSYNDRWSEFSSSVHKPEGLLLERAEKRADTAGAIMQLERASSSDCVLYSRLLIDEVIRKEGSLDFAQNSSCWKTIIVIYT